MDQEVKPLPDDAILRIVLTMAAPLFIVLMLYGMLWIGAIVELIKKRYGV